MAKSQVNFRGKKKTAVYDKLFLMGIYILQSGEIAGYRDEMKALREK